MQNFLLVTWTFHLNCHLQLNITINYLWFFTRRFFCHKGNVTISEDSNQGEIFTFCGQQSIFNVYPGFTHMALNFAVNYFHLLNAEFGAFYSVFNAGHLSNSINNPMETNIPDLISIHKICKDFLYTFLVQTTKFESLILFRAEESMWPQFVFDGPGFLSKYFRINPGVHYLSSFQCIWQVLAEHNFSWNEAITYRSTKLKAVAKLQVQMDPFNVSSRMFCLESPCVFFFKTRFPLYINITLLELKYKSNEYLSCRYGAMLQRERDWYNENNLQCTSHSFQKAPSKSFYSRNTCSAVILYWYEKYTKIDAELSVSATECKAVQMDFCSDFLSTNFSGDCSEYQHHSQIQRFFAKTSIFCLRYNACSIMQLTNTDSPGSKTPDVCQTTFWPGKSQERKIINFEFVGELKHTLTLTGPVQGFCQQRSTSEKLFCSKARKTLHLLSVRLINYVVLNTSIPKAGTEDPFAVFSFSTEAWVHSEEWIDITMRKIGKSIFQYPVETIPIPFKRYILEQTFDFSTHVLMLKSVNVVQNPVIQVSITTMLIRKEMGDLFLSANLVVSFSSLKSVRYIQVYGENNNPMQLQCAQFVCNFSLQASWLNIETLFTDRVVLEILACEEHISPANVVCYNLSTFSMDNSTEQKQYILLKTKPCWTLSTSKVTFEGETFLLSWIQAQSLCKSSNGHLPYFASDFELQHLVQIYKHIFHILPIEATFIGIITQVNNIFCWPSTLLLPTFVCH